MARGPGRPRRASRELLQEAAFELFQLRGYTRTSAELIAKTAGFSRATFFNVFSSKAELFWVETDALIALLSEHLEQRLTDDQPPEVDAALLEYSAHLYSADIPWALQNYQLLDGTDDLIASGAVRVLSLSRLLERYIGQRDSRASERTQDPLALRARAVTLTALLLTALLNWINAGVHRGGLSKHLGQVLQYDR